MVRIEGLGFKRGGQVILDVKALTLEQGSRLAIMGPSGSGKSTLLRLIAGLEHPDRGEIGLVAGTATKDRRLPPHQRSVALLSQDLGLWPHLTAGQHLALVRSRGKTIKVSQTDRNALKQVDLGDLSWRLPKELSGGEQQRLALARVLTGDPGVLLLDEPFANIDWVLRDELMALIETRCDERHITCLLVTHSLDEAVRLASRVMVLAQGRVVQEGSWRDLKQKPATDWIKNLMRKFDACANSRSLH